MKKLLNQALRAVFPFMVAALVGAVVLLIVGSNPLEVYGLIAFEAFGNSRRIAATLTAATPLIFTGVATAICFRTGVFNVGIEGALLLGGLAAAFIGFASPVWLGWGMIPLGLAFAAVVGAIWLWVPGFLLANYKVDEVVSTLMLNFVALGIAGYLVNGPLLSEKAGNNTTPMIHESAELARLMPPSTVSTGLLMGLAIIAGYFVWCRYNAMALESRLIGLNAKFAKGVGISVSSVTIYVMVLSGAVGGLGGGVHALGLVHRFTEGFSPGYGFTGMAVALLGRNSAIGILIGAVIFGALASAGTTIQLFSDIPLDLVHLLEGTVMIFAVVEIGRIKLRKKKVPNAA